MVNDNFLKQAVIERVDAHTAAWLLRDELKDNLMERPLIVKDYLGVFTMNRKKTSRRQVEDCLKVIDRFYDSLVVPESVQRKTLQFVLYKLEVLTRPVSSPLKDLHAKVLELAFRDPHLQVNEKEEKKKELAMQVEELRKKLADMTKKTQTEEDMTD